MLSEDSEKLVDGNLKKKFEIAIDKKN